MTLLHSTRQPPRRPTPPLAQGDRLTRAEFFERYAAMPGNIKAERIEGIVYMPAAAVSAGFHGQPHICVSTWLGVYQSATPGVVAADNSTTSLDPDNDPQPDASLRILPSHGGRTRFTPERYIEGAPELIVEITASSASYDLGAKLRAYCRTGVQEYVAWRTYDGEIDWFCLRGGAYEQLAADADGILRSEVFPGLWLKRDAMIREDLAEVLTVLQRGLASEAHAAFVARLRAASQKP